MRRIWVQLPFDQWPETTSQQKWQERSLRHIKSCNIQVPGLSTSSSTSSTSPTSSSEETVTDTEILATRRSESANESLARRDPLQRSAEIENPNENGDEELQSDELQGVPDRLQEFKHGLVDESVSEHQDTSPLSREQKWYRVHTTCLLTSRRTEIAISA